MLITVLDHPELGQTRSRVDGYFDLAINGGPERTLVYTYPGYLSAHRRVKADWNVDEFVEDVVLTPLDPAATAIDLLENNGTQVAVATEQSDADGERTAVLMFDDTSKLKRVCPTVASCRSRR